MLPTSGKTTQGDMESNQVAGQEKKKLSLVRGRGVAERKETELGKKIIKKFSTGPTVDSTG